MAQSRCQRLSAAPASAGNIRAVETNRPLAGVDETVDHAQKRRFAGARTADDADHLARRNVEVDTLTAVFLPNRRVTSRISSMMASLSGAGFPASATTA